MTESHRELTPSIRRRAWGDPLVRSWWIAALVSLLIAVALLANGYAKWAKLARAIRSGAVVKAKIIAVEGDTRVGRTVTSTSPIGMDYQYNGRSFRNVIGVLDGLVGQVRVGDEIPLRIDPDDPLNWSVRDTVPSAAASLIGPFLVLPVALLCGVIAVTGRAGVIKTYRLGKHATAIVAENRQTPLAPGSRAVRCSLTEGSRMMEVFVPHADKLLKPGDSVEVLLPPGRGRPVAVAWFERE